MTFIASVVARNGVAVIADSLVTTLKSSIEDTAFYNYLNSKRQETPIGEMKLDAKEITALFSERPIYTKDYEEKLFQYDKYTAITTCGAAYVNGKKIECLVEAMISRNRKDKSYWKKELEKKVEELAEYLNIAVHDHLEQFGAISESRLVITHFDKTKEETSIYKICINECSKEQLVDEACICVSYYKEFCDFKVVCDGQSRISERIIFGDAVFFLEFTPKIVEKVIELLQITGEQIPAGFAERYMDDLKTLLPTGFFDDLIIKRFDNISLQEAVDLASLLMKIEMKLQQLTEKIPSVGGVIKLAVIDKDGFRFISGNQILNSENF